MQQLAKKEKKTFLNKEINSKKLSKKDILNFYKKTIPFKNQIGLEYERLCLDKKTLKNVSYGKIEKIIKEFCKITDYTLIYDNLTIIGAEDNNGTSISLEPGCQLEISLLPLENIKEIENKLNEIINILDKISDKYDVIFLGYGISPVSKIDEIELLNKTRYKIMDKFLPNQKNGFMAQKMMRQTAGIQINIDYQNEIDAFNKLKFFNLIMPFMTGLCANSPNENFKTQRANIWLNTGCDRCNLFYKKIFKKIINKKKNIFKNYISEVLKVPMIFINREEKSILINGKINFSQFLKNGFKNLKANFEDYILQQSLCFPDVRLKKYIEIRNHDSSNFSFALALCAFYKGLIQNDCNELLNEFNFLKIDNIEKYNKFVVEKGLNFKINNKYSAWDIVEKLYQKSKVNLDLNEQKYLKPIENLIEKRKTQADILIENRNLI